MDLFPTALALAGKPKLADIIIDGVNLTPLLFESQEPTERPFFFYRGEQIFACRLGVWKAHFKTQTGYGRAPAESHDAPLLFHLGLDPSEKRNVAADHPEVILAIRAAIESHQTDLKAGEPQLR